MRALRWPSILAIVGVGAAVAFTLVTEVRSARWVTRLSADGSPPPALDTKSATGYVHGERYYLGLHERGDTYRWIAATQRLLAVGPLVGPRYDSDNAPTGRDELLPRLYSYWIATVAWISHRCTGESTALAVERAAVWEPIASHVLLLLATAWFLGRRLGLASAAAGALLVAIFPPVSDQFVAGTLAPRPWALFLAAYAVAVTILDLHRVAGSPGDGGRRGADGGLGTDGANLKAAIATALALWLDPEIGFPVVLVCAIGAACRAPAYDRAQNALRWSVAGAVVTIGGWLLDRSPANAAVGELRYVHPYYALAWLGLGLALHVRLSPPTAGGKRTMKIAELAGAFLLVAPLVFAQVKHDYRGWLFPSAAMTRITSLDETLRFGSLANWLLAASPLELLFILAPTATGAVICGWNALSSSRRFKPGSALSTAACYAALVVLACLKVRWLVVTSLVALPIVWESAAQRRRATQIGWLTAGLVFLAGLTAWQTALPPSLRKPDPNSSATAADLEALVSRHFSHWLVSHNAGRPISALAPPELSDSLVFHGGCRVLMSSAWESFDGQVAASRVLSSPEATEAEAVLQSREITHVILPSWDAVLPLLVREPKEAGRTTLYARLQRWILPPYLRPLAYRLPPFPGFEAQKLAVFKVTAPQDEALMLSRLAEYFAEVDRPEPAALVTKVLAESFANDPNATIARAIVAAAANRTAEFDAELERLAAAPTAGEATLPWDRRVQRAIVFALGKRHDLAKAAVERCVTDVSAEALSELTPLQAHRLLTLTKAYGLAFTHSEQSAFVAAIGAEYGD